MNLKILPEFQEFLLANNLVPEKRIPFYAYWVGKFLAFSNNNEIASVNLRIKKFIDFLNKDRVNRDRHPIYQPSLLSPEISILPNLAYKI